MEGRISGSDGSSTNCSKELQDSIKPMITNVVTGFNLTVQVDANHIARSAWNVEYNPKRLNAVVMRLRDPTTTALIFPSGKVVVTGAKSLHDSKVACRKVVRVLRRLDYNSQFREWKVLNLVGLIALRFPLNMGMLSSNQELRGTYEPERFPAFVVKLQRPKMTLQIFSSGKVVLLGFKEEKDMQIALDQIFHVLIQYKRST